MPQFEVKRDGNILVIKTSDAVLTYVADGKRFDADNLKVEFEMNGKPVTWVPGARHSSAVPHR